MATVSQGEKVTIQEAARALGVSKGRVIEYLNGGRLTRIRDGSRIYVLMDEIKALSQRDTSSVEPVGETSRDNDGAMVTVARQHYEELLSRLGQLESENRGLLECRNNMVETIAALGERERELEETKAKLLLTEEELKRIRATGWWRKLLGRE